MGFGKRGGSVLREVNLWSFDVSVSWAHGLARCIRDCLPGFKAVLCCSTYDVDV